MTKFTFLFLDGTIMVFEVSGGVKHYSGHAVLTNAKLVHYDHPVDSRAISAHLQLKVGTVFPRFNVGLYGLRVMWSEEEVSK